MVQKHFADKTAEATRALRAEEAERRRVASFVAREVRGFWGNIERLYDYKVNFFSLQKLTSFNSRNLSMIRQQRAIEIWQVLQVA